MPMQRMSALRFKSPSIYQAVKQLNTTPKSVIDKYIKLCELNGLALDGNKKDVYSFNLSTIEKFKPKFSEQLEHDRIDSMQIISDRVDIPEMPFEYLNRYAYNTNKDGNEGPWYVSFEHGNYETFMSYLKNRERRKSLFLVRNQLAGRKNSCHNGKTIEEILYARRDMAVSLGYSHFLDMSLSTKMARNYDEIYNLLEKLRKEAYPNAVKELTELADFAKSYPESETGPKVNDTWFTNSLISSKFLDSQVEIAKDNEISTDANKRFFGQIMKNLLPNATNNLIVKDIDVWDIPYWSRKYKEYTFPFNQKVLFDYNFVLARIFELCENLFDLTYKRINPNPPELDSDQYECFEIYRNCVLMSHLFIHPHKTDGKVTGVWTELGRNRSSIRNDLPYAVLSLDLAPILPNNVASLKMNFSQLRDLFFQFGRLIPHLLTQVDHSEISGLNYVEKDCEHVSSYVFASFLTQPSFLRRLLDVFPNHIEEVCSKNAEFEAKIKPRLIDDLIKEINHLSSYNLLQECFYSHLDLDIHSSKVYHLDIFKRLWPSYNPFKLIPNINFLTSFTPIFIEDQAASYYGRIWSKIIAADLFTYLVVPETRKNDINEKEHLKFIGNKLLDKVFSVGATVKQRQALADFKISVNSIENDYSRPSLNVLVSEEDCSKPKIYIQSDDECIRNNDTETINDNVTTTLVEDIQITTNSAESDPYEISVEPFIKSSIKS